MLGMALSRAAQERVWKPAISATWLMVLTGWRRGEVLGLRWSEIDLTDPTGRPTTRQRYRTPAGRRP